MLIFSILLIIVLLLITSVSASCSGILLGIGLFDPDFKALIAGSILAIIAFASYGYMISIAN